MVAVIFKTGSIVIDHVCTINVPNQPPEVVAAVIFRKNQLDPSEYTVRQIEGSYTLFTCRNNYYISNNQLYKKPFMDLITDKVEITADGVDKATISNCPEGALVYFNKELAGTVGSDGVVEVTSTVAKKVALTLEKFGYQTERVVINAT